MSPCPPGPAVFLTEMLTPDRVLVPLTARDKRGIITELAQRLVAQTGGSLDEVLRAIDERESVLSTGVGFGVAIPHARSSAVRPNRRKLTSRLKSASCPAVIAATSRMPEIETQPRMRSGASPAPSR